MSQEADQHVAHRHTGSRPRRQVLSYVWLVLKNVLGWIILIAAIPVGWIMPGPNGLLQFIIGFALISLPGKRKLTARMLRGRPVSSRSLIYRLLAVVTAILFPTAIIGYLHLKFGLALTGPGGRTQWMIAIYGAIVIGLMILMLNGVGFVNKMLRGVALVRRKTRPWLRRRGIDLLPPRRRRRRIVDGKVIAETNEEVLELHERHLTRLRHFWVFLRPWLKRTLQIAVVFGAFYLMFRPVIREWDNVRARILQTDWWLFFVAAGMFAVTSLAFRIPSWRWVLRGLGQRLPYRPAARIWSTSEMVRYIPGVIWQVLGRVYLVRPYGISASVCSVSQILEITIFVLANVLIALSTLSIAGITYVPEDQRQYIYASFVMLPIILVLLHPRVFYGVLNRILRWVKKPPISQRLSKGRLLGLAGYAVLAMIWQSLAIWMLTHGYLEMPLSKWWILAGAYSLAWTVGFCLAWMAPAGMGTRELIFVATMSFALPPEIQRNLGDQQVRQAMLMFLGILLRLWTIAGELMVFGLAYLLDYKGALNRPGAPGRLATSAAGSQPTSTETH